MSSLAPPQIRGRLNPRRSANLQARDGDALKLSPSPPGEGGYNSKAARDRSRAAYAPFQCSRRQAGTTAPRKPTDVFARRSIRPIPATPAIIRSQVEGSGAAEISDDGVTEMLSTALTELRL